MLVEVSLIHAFFTGINLLNDQPSVITDALNFNKHRTCLMDYITVLSIVFLYLYLRNLLKLLDVQFKKK
jgi:hypothetical protein